MVKDLVSRIGEVKDVRMMWDEAIITEDIELKEINEDTILLVSSGAKISFPPASEKLSIAIYCTNGVFVFKSEVEKVVFNSPYTFCYIKTPVDFEIKQQREFFRTRFDLNTTLTVYFNNGEKKAINGKTFDISGTGVSLLFSTVMENDNILKVISSTISQNYAKLGLCIHFPEKDVNTKVEFIHKRPLARGSKNLVFAFKFLRINASDVDFITKQCFLKQMTEQSKALKEF